MDISSHITVAVTPEFYQSKMKTGALQPGSTLTMKVIELKGDRALIDLGNFRTTADIKIPVTLGEELTVKVLEAGKQLKLGVINPDPKSSTTAELSTQRSDMTPNKNLNKIQNDVTRMLNQVVNSSDGKKMPSSIFNILATLNAYFEPYELKEIISDLLPRFRSHFENSGIFFEKSLEQVISQIIEEKDGQLSQVLADRPEIKAIFHRDLKPNLLLLQHLIAEKETLHNIFGPGTLSLLKGTIDTLLADITQQQGRAVAQLDSADPFLVFSFTLPLKEGDQAARLKVFYEKKQKAGSKKDFQISLMLSMDRLGDVRTDLTLSGRDLQVAFFVTEPSVKIKIHNNLSELNELLGPLFESIHLNVKVSEKRVKDFDRLDAVTADNRRVDVRI
ncbi:MAG: hypothetical protein QNL11_12445 [Desulfobacterales bacterium]|nr:hypothetical protein [Desulfobacterales bacterium]